MRSTTGNWIREILRSVLQNFARRDLERDVDLTALSATEPIDRVIENDSRVSSKAAAAFAA